MSMNYEVGGSKLKGRPNYGKLCFAAQKDIDLEHMASNIEYQLLIYNNW